MGAANANDGVLDRRASGIFSLLNSFLNRRSGPIQICNHTFVRTARFGNAMAAIAQTAACNLCYQDDSFRAAEIDGCDQVVVVVGP